MENIPDDELISAYLDGELTGQDLARAEQLLAAQPDSRQMLEELTALRATLKSLPQHKLAPDFAESVLRRAEREMLQPGAANAAAALPLPVDTWKSEVPPILSMSRWTRPLIWSALVAAAAIVIMMFSPPDAQQKVAVAPAPQVAAGPAVVDQKFEAHAVHAPDYDVTNNGVGGDEAAPAIAEPMIAKNRPAEALSTAGAGAAASSVASDSAKSGFLAGKANPSYGAGAKGESAASALDSAADAGGLLIVRCDISPEVARSASFRKLLAEQQIPWQAEGEPPSALSGKRFLAKQGLDKRLQDNSGEGKEKDKESKPSAGRQKRDDSPVADSAESGVAQPAPAISTTEAVYVVAAPAQVDAAIAALAQHAEYRNFQVTEVAAPLPTDVYDSLSEGRSAAPQDAIQANRGRSEPETREHQEENSGSASLVKKNVKSGSVASPAPRAVPAPIAAAEGDTTPAPIAPTAPKPANAATPAVGPVSSPPQDPSIQVQRGNSIGGPRIFAQPSTARAVPVPMSDEAITDLYRAAGNNAAEVSSRAEQLAIQPLDSAPGDTQPEFDVSLPKEDAPKPSEAQGAAALHAQTPAAASQNKPGALGGKRPAVRSAPAAPPAPAAAPASAPGPKSMLRSAQAPASDGLSTADKAQPDQKPATSAKGQPPQAEPAKDAAAPATTFAAGDSKGAALIQEGAVSKQALFLFRVVPASAEPRQP